jgi:hypothetical protein
VFRSITDAKLFDLVDSIISRVNQDDTSYTYSLRRNDVTHIKYETGGFFKRHRDYLSTTSNLIEEFTLLLCVTPDILYKQGVIGGNTTIHLFGTSKEFDTTTPGCGIIFRKDLEHEGMVLQRGEKHIITVNLWATRKETSKQVLLVTFPLAQDEGDDGKGGSFPAPSLRDVADASTSYVLPVDILTGMLATYVQWANQAAEREGKDMPPVVTYECRDYDFDKFGVVYKVLTRSYVKEEAIYAAKDCLDYFGPFNYSNILVDLSLEAQSKSSSDDYPHTDKKVKQPTNDEHTTDKDFDSNLIICESEARMHAVANAALALGETKYVPFKMLFVEGVLEVELAIETHAMEIPMQPFASLFGDYDNIFCLRKLIPMLGVQQKVKKIEPHSLHDTHENRNLLKSYPISSNTLPGAKTKVLDVHQFREFLDPQSDNYCEDYARRFFDTQKNAWTDGFSLGLKVGLQGPGDTKSGVLNSAVVHYPSDVIDERYNLLYLPGLASQGKECDDNVSLFHRNEKGEVVFTDKEAERASDFIASSNMEERVKAALQKKRFVLPQETASADKEFCNESIYGSVNILWVCGVVKLDIDSPCQSNPSVAAAPSQKFDAWPSIEAKKKMNGARAVIQKSIRDVPPLPWEKPLKRIQRFWKSSK